MTEIKDQDDAISEVSSVYDISHPREMEWRLKIFLEFLEVYLIRLALETSRTRIPSRMPSNINVPLLLKSIIYKFLLFHAMMYKHFKVARDDA